MHGWVVNSNVCRSLPLLPHVHARALQVTAYLARAGVLGPQAPGSPYHLREDEACMLYARALNVAAGLAAALMAYATNRFLKARFLRFVATPAHAARAEARAFLGPPLPAVLPHLCLYYTWGEFYCTVSQAARRNVDHAVRSAAMGLSLMEVTLLVAAAFGTWRVLRLTCDRTLQ